MNPYPDTSFLCAIYRLQDNSPRAAALFEAMPEPLPVSSLLLFEFRQSVRYQTALHAKDRRKGYPPAEGAKMLADLESDLAAGALVIATYDNPLKEDYLRLFPGAQVVSSELSNRGTLWEVRLSNGAEVKDLLKSWRPLPSAAEESVSVWPL